MENRSPNNIPKLPGPVFANAGETRPEPRPGGFARLFGPLDRWLSSPGHSDPLHVSNRGLGHKLLVWVAIVGAILAFVGVIYYSQSAYSRPHTAEKETPAAAAEPAAKFSPGLPNADVEVIVAQVVHGTQTTLEGTVRNRSSRAINGAEITFDVADINGSHLGAVLVKVGTLDPMATTKFKTQIPQTQAEFAIVRESHAH
jgi:hypothetical protein